MISLEELIANILEINEEQVKDTISPWTVSSWNSQRHIQIIVALEEIYDVSFSSAEIRSLKSFADIRSNLHKKGVSV